MGSKDSLSNHFVWNGVEVSSKQSPKPQWTLK